jgi:hypothetical protein
MHTMNNDLNIGGQCTYDSANLLADLWTCVFSFSMNHMHQYRVEENERKMFRATGTGRGVLVKANEHRT